MGLLRGDGRAAQADALGDWLEGGAAVGIGSHGVGAKLFCRLASTG